MRRLFYTSISLMMIMLSSTGIKAQQLVGESDPFVFDTRQTEPVVTVPLSDYAPLIVLVLAVGLILFRSFLQKRKLA